MTIYILNFALICVYWAVYREITGKYGENKKLMNFFMILIGVQLVSIIAFRGVNIGIDTKPYLARFNQYKSFTWQEIFADERQETGYSLLIKCVDCINGDFTIFTLAVAILSVVPVVVTVTKCSKKPFLSILLFIAFDYYAFMFSGMRQGIAYGICIFSFLFIKDKKIIRFLVTVLIAAQFHKSAYIFLPAYFIAYRKLDKTTITMMLIAFVLIVVFKNRIYDFVEGTLYQTDHGAYKRGETGAFLWPVLMVAISIVVLLLKENAQKADEKFALYAMLLCMGAILMPFTSIGSNAVRMTAYYNVYLIFGIPGMINGIENRQIYTIANLGIGLGVLVLFLRFLMVDGYNIVPYVPFWTT